MAPATADQVLCFPVFLLTTFASARWGRAGAAKSWASFISLFSAAAGCVHFVQPLWQRVLHQKRRKASLKWIEGPVFFYAALPDWPWRQTSFSSFTTFLHVGLLCSKFRHLYLFVTVTMHPDSANFLSWHSVCKYLLQLWAASFAWSLGCFETHLQHSSSSKSSICLNQCHHACYLRCPSLFPVGIPQLKPLQTSTRKGSSFHNKGMPMSKT